MKKNLLIAQRRGGSPEGGYMIVTALLFFLVATTAVIAGISNAVFREVRTIRNEALSKQSYFTAESAVEDAAYRIKEGKTIGASGTLDIANTTATITVVTAADGSKEIEAEGDADGTKRTAKLVLAVENGISFPYALFGGLGGIDMSGSSMIIGDIYTTGSIRGCGSCQVTGAAVAAGRSVSTLDQDNSLPIPATQSIIFGNSNATQDLSQSFTVSDAKSVLQIDLYVKKTGNPSNATVRITTDNAGKPSSTILASGSLLSSSLTTSYQWIAVPLTAYPVLAVGTTYWIVVDANTSSGNYYTVGGNASYGGGQAKVGRYTNNTWINTTPAGLDSYFKVYIGENQEGITGESQWNNLEVGSAYSYKASYLDVVGDLYCQIGVFNNKACDTSRADPVVNAAPVPSSMITALQSEAATSIHSGNYTIGGSSNVTLGPKKITGNLTVGDSGVLRVAGTLWVEGDILFDGSANIYPDDATENYAIVVGGTVTLTGSAEIHGGPNNHIVVISTSTADPAVHIQGSADDTIVVTGDGGLKVSGSGKVNVAAAKHITLEGSAQVIYDPTASVVNLTSGVISTDFQIKSWKETE